MKPGIQGVRTQWIRGFMALLRARRRALAARKDAWAGTGDTPGSVIAGPLLLRGSRILPAGPRTSRENYGCGPAGTGYPPAAHRPAQDRHHRHPRRPAPGQGATGRRGRGLSRPGPAAAVARPRRYRTARPARRAAPRDLRLGQPGP